ncbi:hypothetical protein BDQ17DRAFT_1234523, partial [Cyathus striatus]
IILTYTFAVGSLLLCSSGFIRHRCYVEMGKLFTYEMSIKTDHKLIVTGPYSVVRHPGYAGVLLMDMGMLCIHASRGSWIRESGFLSTFFGQAICLLYVMVMMTVTTGLLRRLAKEEEAMKNLFPVEWDQWARNVRYKLVPGVC